MATSIVPIICRLSVGAVDDIVLIENVSNRPPWPADLFRGEFKYSYSYTYGARAGGELVAFLVAHHVLDELHILNFGVKPELRGKGIGKKLLAAVLHEFFRKSARWATLEVRRSNDVAKSLYDKFGFFEVGIREKYYTDDGEDGLVLRLDMDSFVSANPEID